MGADEVVVVGVAMVVWKDWRGNVMGMLGLLQWEYGGRRQGDCIRKQIVHFL